MDNTTTNVQRQNMLGDFPEPQISSPSDTSGDEMIYNPVKKRKSISYKSELEKMRRECWLWKHAFLMLSTMVLIAVILLTIIL